MKSDAEIAKDLYKRFKAKPESDFIASEFSLFHLAQLLTDHSFRSVLEVGAGIGTITELLRTHPRRPDLIVSTEAVPVCLAELEKNMRGVDDRGWSLIAGMSEIEPDAAFDLIIFDGHIDQERQYELFRDGTWCFVDGRRFKTRIAMNEHLGRSGLTIDFQGYSPGVTDTAVRWRTGPFGIPYPKVIRTVRKGCFEGQVKPLAPH